MHYGVRSLKVGRIDIPGPELFWMSAWNEWYPLDFQVVLIQGGPVTALVNTGPPQDLTALNNLWVSILGERARMQRAPDEFVTNVLWRASVTPEQITHVILTPLQMYTVANVALFKNARVCISKRGWIHYHTTHSHPHDSRWHTIPKDILIHLTTDAWDRVCLLEDEDEIAPGLRTWWAGTHHRATVAVEVDTTQGTVVISDAFFYYENVEDNRLLGINESMYEALASNERARRAAHRVPLYDPKVFTRYRDGVVAAACR